MFLYQEDADVTFLILNSKERTLILVMFSIFISDLSLGTLVLSTRFVIFDMFTYIFFITYCGRLTLAESPGAKAPLKLLSLPSSAGQGREHINKSSWVELRARKAHSPAAIMGKTDSTWGNYYNLLPIKSEKNNEKQTKS